MTIRFTLRDLRDQKSWKLSLRQRHVFQLKRLQAHVLELEDVFFNHNSAVLLPQGPDASSRSAALDDKPIPPDSGSEAAASEKPSKDTTGDITGISVLAAVYRHAEGNPAQSLLITGHTDSSGKIAYNEELSRERTACTTALLEGDRDRFVQIAKKWGKVEDYQTILNWLHRRHAWPCSSGKVDNVHGPQTSKAVRAAQAACNSRYLKLDKPRLGLPGPEEKLVVDGAVGTNTWGGFFDLYMVGLCDLLKVRHLGLETWRGHLKWLDPKQKSVGCGEAHPIAAEGVDEYRSQRNRRTELVFFLDSERPDLQRCHAAQTCTPDGCELYDRNLYRLSHLPPDVDGSLAYDYEVEFCYHNPEKLGSTQLSLESAKTGGKQFKSGDSLDGLDLRYVVRDDHGVPLSENLDWLGDRGGASKLDNYQKLGLMPTVEPRVPFRLKVRRKLSDGTYGEIHEGMVHLEVYVEDPKIDLAAHPRPSKTTTFVQDVVDLHKHVDGDDNAVTDLGGRRSGKDKLAADQLLASYDGVDASKGAAQPLPAPAPGEPFQLDAPASQEVDGTHQSHVDLVLTPGIQLGDNFRLRVKVVEDPNLEFKTGTWTHWKRLRIDGVVSVGSPQALDYELVRAVYRASFIELEPPQTTQVVTLSEGAWKITLKKYFATTSETIAETEYKYGKYMLPDHAFKSRGELSMHSGEVSKALLREGLAKINKTHGFVVLYAPMLHPTRNTLNGLSLGGQRIVLHDRGQTAANLANTLAHEMGHSLYLRHAYTNVVKVKRGSKSESVKVDGDQVMSSLVNAHMVDHNPAEGSTCIMSYFRDRSVAKFCGFCQLNLGMYDKAKMLSDPGIQSMRSTAWGTIKLYDRVYKRLRGPVRLAIGDVFQFRLVTDVEPGGTLRREVTNLARWTSSDASILRDRSTEGQFMARAKGTATVSLSIDATKLSHTVVVS
ncbi:MAG: hypothetical protein V3V08_16115 [Nannocystaceae bacterium]